METWKHPTAYSGFSPDGDYLLISVHRESDSLSRSNWIRVREDMGSEPYEPSRPFYNADYSRSVGADAFPDRPNVYDWRAGHFLVGWVDYLMVRHDAPAEIIAKAREISDSLEDYPVYDESHWSQLEFDEACDYWESMSIHERMEYLREAGLSIFAARHSYMPEDPNGRLYERLTAI